MTHNGVLPNRTPTSQDKTRRSRLKEAQLLSHEILQIKPYIGPHNRLKTPLAALQLRKNHVKQYGES